MPKRKAQVGEELGSKKSKSTSKSEKMNTTTTATKGTTKTSRPPSKSEKMPKRKAQAGEGLGSKRSKSTSKSKKMNTTTTTTKGTTKTSRQPSKSEKMPKRKAQVGEELGSKKSKSTSKSKKMNTTTTATKGTTATSQSPSKSGLNLQSCMTDEGWLSALKGEFDKDYFIKLESMLDKDYKDLQIFPPKDLIFNAFNKTPLKKVKVVILGQDPYHDDGQAMGMSFSVPEGIPLPPSLKNIYKELVNDKDIKNFKDVPKSGCLEKWAERGVLLINATLTVEAHKPNSHKSYGWQTFTDNVIKTISDQKQEVVFLLWGGFAHKKEKLIDSSKHSVIKTAHPSPLSFSKFLGCKCFSNVNAELKKRGQAEIDWTI